MAKFYHNNQFKIGNTSNGSDKINQKHQHNEKLQPNPTIIYIFIYFLDVFIIFILIYDVDCTPTDKINKNIYYTPNYSQQRDNFDELQLIDVRENHDKGGADAGD